MWILRLLCIVILLTMPTIASAMPSVIVSANRNDAAIKLFVQSLDARLPNYSVSFVASNELYQTTVTPNNIYILVGENPLRWHMQLNNPPPSIVLKISQVQGQHILGEHRTHNQLLLWNDPPAKLQLKLLTLLSKRFKRVGIPYTEQSAFLIPEIEQAAEKLGLKVTTRQLSAYDNISDLRYLLQRSDILLGIDDITLYNPYSIKSILLTSYADRIPLLGPSFPYVDAGALATVYADQDNWIESIAYWLNQPVDQWPSESYASRFRVKTNSQVAHSLSLTLPSDSELAKLLLLKENTYE
ncbi:hypothetical protein VQ643_00230 [Pseudomonas sp. F1_0610]|uniref:hypothetical protein n=1 Tax=Pseudomonas sp. F1_0610 TaxID=3114284 RepID=UPI0039C0F95A